MKTNILYLLLSVGLISWTGCEDDDNAVGGNDELNYAGVNFTAPVLPEGSHIFAAYFPSRITSQFNGQLLERVNFFVSDFPDAAYVLVFAEGPTDDAPGDLLYEFDITNRINVTGPFSHQLTTPIAINGEGLWLAIEVALPDTGTGQSVGCDQGQNYNPNGDRLFLQQAGEWTSFQELNGERVNWNISGEVR